MYYKQYLSPLRKKKSPETYFNGRSGAAVLEDSMLRSSIVKAAKNEDSIIRHKYTRDGREEINRDKNATSMKSTTSGLHHSVRESMRYCYDLEIE